MFSKMSFWRIALERLVLLHIGVRRS